MAAIRAALAVLHAEYGRTAPAQLAELAGCVERARRGDAPGEALAEARRLAHRIHGSAGSCGWPALSEAAGRIEDTLDGALAGAGGALGEEALGVIAAALAEARAALAAEG